MDWIIENSDTDREGMVANGNRMLIANGYMGYRGTPEEAGSAELCALNMAGLYDKSPGAWRETVNMPNPLHIRVTADGQAQTITEKTPLFHRQSLDFRYGVYRRETEFDKVKIVSRRYLSMEDCHFLYCEYRVEAKADCAIEISAGYDLDDIWDINGRHLSDFTVEECDGIRTIKAHTLELGVAVESSQRIFGGEFCDGSTRFTLEKGMSCTLEVYTTVHTGNDKDYHDGISRLRLKELVARGGEVLFEAHKKAFDRLWADCDVEIDGDEAAQYALRYSIYHLLIIAPRHSDSLSIAARGLSGQVYKGAVFWDTEIFMLPFYSHTLPEAAASIMKYRVDTLPGAREKAKGLGLDGAFYAWESQEGGREACSKFNVTDVFTGRPVRTYFMDKQIHISGAVVYGMWKTYELAGDIALLRQYSEVIFASAEFYASYVYYHERRGRYEVLDVTGPDEYHERVNNNFYTSLIVRYTLEKAVETDRLLGANDPKISEYKRILEKLYIPAPNEAGVIEQFDGYFGLEDCTLAEVRARVLDEREYWGTSSGIAANTQVIKQADVILALVQMGEDYSDSVKRSCWEYYEPRTEHGSSLSPCVYGLLACELGMPEWAYRYFLKTARIDIEGGHKNWAGLVYIGGTHPAANAGAWSMAVLGFAGLRVKNGVPELSPSLDRSCRLPESWERLSFRVKLRGVRYRAVVTKKEAKIERLDNE